MNFDPSAPQPACQIILATLKDVDRAFYDLKKDMNPDFVHVFLDKMQRYATKPDRALFLASYQNSFIAFGTTPQLLKYQVKQRLSSWKIMPVEPGLWFFPSSEIKALPQELLNSGSTGHDKIKSPVSGLLPAR